MMDDKGFLIAGEEPLGEGGGRRAPGVTLRGGAFSDEREPLEAFYALQGLAIALGWSGQLRVADRCPISAHVDRIHHREGAADPKGEPQKDADQRRPEGTH
jgi:hypothetical protein